MEPSHLGASTGARRLPAGLALTLLIFSQLACVARISEPSGSSTPPPRDRTPAEIPAADDPSVLAGVDHWNAQCTACHGAFIGDSGISTGNSNGDFRLDAEAAVNRHASLLEAYISEQMPKGAASACEGECAQNTGAYIRSRQRTVVELACDPQDTFIYGVRELKLLTSHEYQRSLDDLLGVPTSYQPTVANNDASLGGFANMRGKGINSATLESYVANAEAIAAWAVANGRPFTCSAPAECGRRFVDEFLFRAFRGPVPDAQRALYLALFEDYPAEGMQLALEAALTSPHFLYRIETGVELSTALERGYYTTMGTGDGPPTVTAGDVVETIEASSFPPGNGRLQNGQWGLFENGAIQVTFTTEFTDPAVIVVEARGTNHEAAWPELTVRVGGNLVGTVLVDNPALETFRFDLTGQTGSPTVRLEFNNDSGVPPYGPGMDANLFIARVSLATASATPSDDDPTPVDVDVLEGVATDAYVLTPYEFASALSFMLTGSTPDDRLLRAASNDQLTTRAQIQAQVERLIDSPRGRAHFANFVTEWFGLDKIGAANRPDVPELTPEIKEAMVREVQEHFLHVFYDDAAPYSEFFGGDYTFLNRPLADFYGIGGDFSDEFTQATVTGRGGPIASGAFMTVNAHVERTAPILRAVHARQSALCHYIDPPNSPLAGENIDAQRAEAQMRVEARENEDGALSSRDFYFLYTDGIDACAGCHERIINPMFGLEDFDNVGRLRPAAGADAVIERVGGIDRIVSLMGTLYGIESTADGQTLTFTGAKDFSNKIANTEAVRKCLVRRGFRYVTGLTFFDRDVDTGRRETLTDEQRRAYSCTASRMMTALEANQSPRDMFVALATDSLLRLRR